MSRMMDLVAEVNRSTFDYVLGGFDEALQLTRYRAEALGHYGWHSDRGGTGLAQYRKLTVVVQLSVPESYEGGDLQLNVTGHAETMPRTRGAAIAFPSYVLHRVTPVTFGARHSLVTWVHGPSFR
jgi:PKHD-type hydroxylase